jgi:hypothetical protein
MCTFPELFVNSHLRREFWCPIIALGKFLVMLLDFNLVFSLFLLLLELL